MGFEKLRTGGQDIVERFPRLSPNTRMSGHQDELLARERLLEAPQGFGEFGLSDVIECFQEILDHMELIVNDLDSGAMLSEAVTEGFPHVHHPVCDHLSPLFAKPIPEFLEVPFFAPLDDVKELGTSGTFRGA